MIIPLPCIYRQDLVDGAGEIRGYKMVGDLIYKDLPIVGGAAHLFDLGISKRLNDGSVRPIQSSDSLEVISPTVRGSYYIVNDCLYLVREPNKADWQACIDESSKVNETIGRPSSVVHMRRSRILDPESLTLTGLDKDLNLIGEMKTDPDFSGELITLLTSTSCRQDLEEKLTAEYGGACIINSHIAKPAPELELYRSPNPGSSLVFVTSARYRPSGSEPLGEALARNPSDPVMQEILSYFSVDPLPFLNPPPARRPA